MNKGPICVHGIPFKETCHDCIIEAGSIPRCHSCAEKDATIDQLRADVKHLRGAVERESSKHRIDSFGWPCICEVCLLVRGWK